ncbi:MAG: esterase-like activity of phytase family protein [Phycisphaerales bacterium]|nr:esterase-like activity of phytase family protein [Phycisphaerales bacterium]
MPTTPRRAVFTRLPAALAAAALAVILPSQPAAAQPTLAITFRGTTPLTGTPNDQNGQAVTPTGLSGISWAGPTDPTRWAAVMDNSNKILFLAVNLSPNGTVTSVSFTSALSLSETRDFEGIALPTPSRGTVYLAEEDTPALHEFRLSDGLRLRTFPAPAVFSSRVPNFGFESLSLRADAGALWTANEEALTADGPRSTPTAGTIIRLLQYAPLAGPPDTFIPIRQFAYLTNPIPGPTFAQARSGVSDMIALPNGRLLVLERSLAFDFTNPFQSRIYEVRLYTPSGQPATDVSQPPYASGLSGQTYTLAQKILLWQGNVTNMEGLALGPRLASGNFSLLGIVDNGDGLSQNTLVAFELAGPVCPGDIDGNHTVGASDLSALLSAFGTAAGQAGFSPAADLDGNGAVGAADLSTLLSNFALTCP